LDTPMRVLSRVDSLSIYVTYSICSICYGWNTFSFKHYFFYQ